ncbi:MAG TPA: cupin [Patescibacteria group bacterium]|nr:cupin [Patescibacteria group bacterium]
MVDVAGRLRAEGLDPSSWSSGPGDRFAAHEHGYDKVIAVVSGSISFGLRSDRQAILLEAGDRLELPAGTVHDARAGSSGVTCLEAQLPVGRLLAVARRAAGMW